MNIKTSRGAQNREGHIWGKCVLQIGVNFPFIVTCFSTPFSVSYTVATSYVFQGFGKADHEVTVGLLKNKYPDYNISWSDEGY